VTEALRFASVGFAYGRLPVFDDLSLAIAAGEITAVLGPNGSGKTTWVRLASGSVPPGRGEVLLFGRDHRAWGRVDRARTVAVVPQESHLDLAFRVRDVVAMGRAPHQGLLGVESDEDRDAIAVALSATGLEPLAHRPYARLSGGEKQRAIVARALAQRPRLLLLDEPTAHLDLKHRIGMYALLERLHAAGLTVVVVSHDLDLAARHCRRLVLLRHGRIAADGAPADVLRPDVLRDVYEVDVSVRADPGGGAPWVLPGGPPRA
jgi:iron complex transport system ATP-binding protein